MIRLLLALVLIAAALAGAVAALNLRGEDPVEEIAAADAARQPDAAELERGRYLALAGNCAGCHTARGGAPYAGGTGIDTPFGTVYASNLTPDPGTGIGEWSASHFWRALHNGRSRDGRLLYPVFPYPNYTRITREDSDAIYAWLRTLAPVERPNTPDTLRSHTTRSCRSPCGARCSSSRARTSRTPAARRNGTAAPTSSTASGTATPAIPGATCSARPAARSTSAAG